MTDDAIALLQEINRKLDDLKHDAPGRKRGLVYSEFLLMGKVLPALGSKFPGGAVFTVNDVLESPVFQALLNMNSKCAGNLFARAEDWVIDNYRLERSGSFDRHVNCWTVVMVV